jgi:hypothetical protein
LSIAYFVNGRDGALCPQETYLLFQWDYSTGDTRCQWFFKKLFLFLFYVRFVLKMTEFIPCCNRYGVTMPIARVVMPEPD